MGNDGPYSIGDGAPENYAIYENSRPMREFGHYNSRTHAETLAKSLNSIFNKGRSTRAVIAQHLKILCFLAEERQLDFGNEMVKKMFDDARLALKEDGNEMP
jgi:hypothetical protein